MTRDNENDQPSIKNYAEDNAKLYGILPQSVNESGAEFRERVARELWKQGRRVEANETLSNRKESGNPFSLDNGYGDEFITRKAEAGEAQYQELIHPEKRSSIGLWLLGVLVLVIIVIYLLVQAGGLH